MKANFGIEREKQNQLTYIEYENDADVFHFHSQIELYFIDEGEMDVCINDKRTVLCAGEMSVALSYDAHTYSTPDHSKSSVLIIPTHWCEEFVSLTEHKRNTTPFIYNKVIVRKIKDNISELQKTNNELRKKGAIYNILGLVFECIDLQTVSEPIDADLTSKILFYVNENFKSDLSLSCLASEFGYTASHISRHFKSVFHIGFTQYLNTIRLKNALLLLKTKKYSVTYCAFESGFNSVRTFYRAFQKEFHCSPRDYLY
ncbi:MAG: helix-turn-helix transcriptional regulator [Clostridia bacterium]|nr:helix-turn-helix transcriptional regulator [Clostridia bacterium]